MNDQFNFSRRSVLKSAGALTLAFALPMRGMAAGDDGELRGNLKRNPNLSSWFRVHNDGTVTLMIGKVELGQGTVTSAAQCAADELQIDIARLNIVSGDTFDGPDEGTTAGSGSAPGGSTRQRSG